jgi:hypothetical protein
MGIDAFGPFITNITGGIGGVRAIHRQGKLTLVKRTKPKLSMTPAAVRTRQMYATLECIWCNMREEFRQGYLLGCRVPHLSGRDLFTRINWHQVAEWDEYRPLPLNLQPMAAVKTHLAGNLAVPAEWLAGLGGPLHPAAGALSRTGRSERAATGVAPTLQGAVNVAYAMIAATPWHASLSSWRAAHWMINNGGPPYEVVVSQLRSSWLIAGGPACARLRSWTGARFGGIGGIRYQGGLTFAGAAIAAANGWQWATGAPPDFYVDGDAQEALDSAGWAPLALPFGAGQITGWAALDLACTWTQRG